MSSLTALVPVLCRVWLTIRSAANAHSFEFCSGECYYHHSRGPPLPRSFSVIEMACRFGE